MVTRQQQAYVQSLLRKKLQRQQALKTTIQRRLTAGPTLSQRIQALVSGGIRARIQDRFNQIQIPVATPPSERALIGPVMTTDPLTLQDMRRRSARQKGWETEASESFGNFELIPSSFIVGLEWIDSPTDFEHVILHVRIEQSNGNKIWYSYRNVPRGVVMEFWQGNASCTTDAPGGFTGRKRKLWWVGKNPSLGAFFNQYIKHNYSAIRGRVYS